MEEQINYDEIWEKIEAHGVPCNIRLLTSHKETYTGAGREYTPLWTIVNKEVPVILEEIKRDKGGVLWGRLRSGEGWIELIDIQFCDE